MSSVNDDDNAPNNDINDIGVLPILSNAHKRDLEMITIAMQVAQNSALYQKHGAVIVGRGGKIIATGYNNHKNGHHSSCFSTHAEIDAFNKCDRSLLLGARMYVVRLNRHNINIPRNSKPCYDCERRIKKMIREYGLEKVFYTTDDHYTTDDR